MLETRDGRSFTDLPSHRLILLIGTLQLDVIWVRGSVYSSNAVALLHQDSARES